MRQRIFFLLLFLLAGTLVCEAAAVHQFKNETLGISFDYPQTLTIDQEDSREDPLSVVFRQGRPPLSVSILLKEVAAGDLEAFISSERIRQEEGGYRSKVEEKRYVTSQQTPAIEFVRDSPVGTIYYFV